jgi:hypothetical protein
MNNRIKAIAKQANWSDDRLSAVNAEAQNRKLQEFAELIIKECVRLMEDEQKMCADPGSYQSREYYERMEAKESAYEDAAARIRYHFGVK